MDDFIEKTNKVSAARLTIFEALLNALEKNSDYISALRTVAEYWSNAKLSDDDDLYYHISAILDDLELVIKGNARDNYSREYLEKYDQLEKKYYEDNEKEIKILLESLYKLIKNK